MKHVLDLATIDHVKRQLEKQWQLWLNGLISKHERNINMIQVLLDDEVLDLDQH